MRVQTISSLSGAGLVEEITATGFCGFSHRRHVLLAALCFPAQCLLQNRWRLLPASLNVLEISVPHQLHGPTNRLEARPLVVTPSSSFRCKLGSVLPTALSVWGFTDFTAFAFSAVCATEKGQSPTGSMLKMRSCKSSRLPFIWYVWLVPVVTVISMSPGG
jgi:hypothetical protein